MRRSCKQKFEFGGSEEALANIDRHEAREIDFGGPHFFSFETTTRGSRGGWKVAGGDVGSTCSRHAREQPADPGRTVPDK